MPVGHRSKPPPELMVPLLLRTSVSEFQCHTRAASRFLGTSQGPRWLEDVLALPVLASLPSGRRKGSCCHRCWFPRTGLSRCLYFTKVPLPTTYCPSCAVWESYVDREFSCDWARECACHSCMCTETRWLVCTRRNALVARSTVLALDSRSGITLPCCLLLFCL